MPERQLDKWFQGSQKVSGRVIEIREPSGGDSMKLPRAMHREREGKAFRKQAQEKAGKGRGAWKGEAREVGGKTRSKGGCRSPGKRTFRKVPS